jgi:hypothetical protein
VERGSWEARLIEGEKADVEIETGFGAVSMEQRVGGLRMLPTHILPWHRRRLTEIGQDPGMLPKTLQTFKSYLPKSKSIEAMFHRLQRFEGTLWGALGRDQQRCPFEKTKRIYEACKRGAEDPGLHFLSADEMLTRLDAICRAYAEEPIEGRVFNGRPDEVWANGLAEHGALRRLPEKMRHLYRRDWSVVKIERGMAHAQRQDPATGKPQHFFYANADLFGRADVDGRRALVYFDALCPTEPAEIVSLKGEWLGQAEFVEKQGMFFGTSEQGHRLRREMAGAVLTYYSDVAAEIPSLQVPEEIADRRREAKREAAEIAAEATTPAPAQVAPIAEEPRHTMRFEDGRRERLETESREPWAGGFHRRALEGAMASAALPPAGRMRTDDLRRRTADAEQDEERLRLAGALL